MDKVKPKAKNKMFTKKNLIAVIAISLLFIVIFYANQRVKQVSLDKQGLIFTKVKYGNIELSVDGYGRLASEKLQLITTLSQATVKEIILKPGAKVTKDSVIVVLDNPELLQQVENAQQVLAQIRANLRQLKLNQQRELLDEESLLAELEALFETAELRRMAEEKLVAEGIVSELTYKESVLNEKQLTRRIAILYKKVEQLALVHQEGINIQQERIKQQQGKLNIAQERIDKLNVRAGFDGVLQKLSVSLGQSLSPGQEVALIGSVTELIALIRVPQSQAQLVDVGQSVEIDTRQDKIIGKVTRIDPIVAENTVEVEVSLPKDLPKSARPQQSVDAMISVKTLNNIHYIERPINVVSNTKAALYRLNVAESKAMRITLNFGEKTSKYIEIRNGAQVGQKFILSDLTNYQASEISVN